MDLMIDSSEKGQIVKYGQIGLKHTISLSEVHLSVIHFHVGIHEPSENRKIQIEFSD